MKLMSMPLLRRSLLGIALTLMPGLALAQVAYRLTDLGTLGGTMSEPLAMNEAGQVIGRSSTAGDAETHAFLWDGNTMRDLGTLGGTYSAAVAINSTGQVTGYSYLAGDQVFHAFLWDGAILQDIHLTGTSSSFGSSVNDSGMVAGYGVIQVVNPELHGFLFDGVAVHDLGAGTMVSSINASGQLAGRVELCCSRPTFPDYHAALWSGNSLLDLTLQTPDPDLWRQGSAVHINDSGQVAGDHHAMNMSGTSGASFLFLWDGTAMRLGTLDGRYCFSHAVNAVGLVLGQCYVSSDTVSHAVLFDGTTMHDLGTLGGTYAWGSDLNASGNAVVGDSYTAGDVDYHPFFWDGTTMHDLNDLVAVADPLKPYVTLVGAQGTFINERGQIVTNGIDNRTAESHAYLLSPVRVFTFAGFFSPVDITPTLNIAKAGSAIPIKFSLGGDQGLDIFAAGYPKSQRISCDTSVPLDEIEETVTAGSSSLSYSTGADRYLYVWKTEKAWAGTCRQLIVKLNDFTDHVANFTFK